MLTVTKRFTFEAAHMLEGHPGKCCRVHGHSYKLEVTVARYDHEEPEGMTNLTNEKGMVVDFGDLSTIVEENVISKFDHAYLNDYIINPTAEMLLKEIYNTLTHILISLGNLQIRLIRLRLWETEKCYAEWTDD